MLSEFVFFILGIFVTVVLVIIFDNNNDLDAPKLKDYYKMMAERAYYQTEYLKIHDTLTMLDEDDVQLISKEHYNYFVLKKKDYTEFKDLLKED